MNRPINRRDFLKLGGGALAGGLVFGLAGCTGGASEDGVRLRMAWWGGQSRNRSTVEALDLFEENHPDITIEREFIESASAYGDRLATQTAGGNAPDVIQTYPELTTEYAERGAFLDLDPLVGSVIDLNDFDEGVIENGRRNGGLYEIAFGLSSPAVFYNTALLEQTGIEAPDYAGLTWDEYAEAARAISENTPDGVYGAENNGWAFTNFEIFVRQQGRELFDEEGQITFTREDLIDWFSYWEDLRRSGAVVPADVTSQENPFSSHSVRSLATGRAAMAFEYATLLVELQSLVNDPLAISMIPHGPDDPRSGQHLRLGVSLSISADSEYQEEAAELINFMVNDDRAVEILGLDRGVPAGAEAREALRSEAAETEREIIDYIEYVSGYSTPLPQALPPAAGDMNNLMPRIQERIMFGQVSVEEGADEFMAEAEEYTNR